VHWPLLRVKSPFWKLLDVAGAPALNLRNLIGKGLTRRGGALALAT